MNLTSCLLILTFIFIVKTSAEKTRYDNYRVYSILVENEQHLKILQDLENSSEDGYLFWVNPSIIGSAVDLMVSPQKFDEFDALKLKSTLKIENVQQLIDNEQPKIMPRVFGWTSYHTFDEIYEWMDGLVESNNETLSHINAGFSHEGREIRGVKLSHGIGRKSIIIESNIHAREWITSATSTYILNELLTSEDPEIIALATSYDWYFIPIANPDGFVYTHESTRLWRKTRYPHTEDCYGADPNRNFNNEWMGAGASDNPCSELYAGPYAWSEIESFNLALFYSAVPNAVVYIAFHSYGQYLLFPFAHDLKGENYDDLMVIGNATVNTLEQVHGTQYVAGTFFDALYPASGVSTDYAHASLNIPITVCWENRDKGEYGFILPADQIIPNSEEVLEGLVTFIDEADNLGYFN